MHACAPLRCSVKKETTLRHFWKSAGSSSLSCVALASTILCISRHVSVVVCTAPPLIYDRVFRKISSFRMCVVSFLFLRRFSLSFRLSTTHSTRFSSPRPAESRVLCSISTCTTTCECLPTPQSRRTSRTLARLWNVGGTTGASIYFRRPGGR